MLNAKIPETSDKRKNVNVPNHIVDVDAVVTVIAGYLVVSPNSTCYVAHVVDTLLDFSPLTTDTAIGVRVTIL